MKTHCVWWSTFIFIALFILEGCLDSSEDISSGEILCGHWAVKNMCNLVGVPSTIEEIVKEMPKGSDHSMHDIFRELKKHDVICEGARIDYKELAEISSLPAIVHFTVGHFEVLYKIREGRVYTFGENGERKVYTLDDFRRRWSGNVLRRANHHLAKNQTRLSGSHVMVFNSLYLEKEISQNEDSCEFEFSFRNTGREDISIIDIKKSCSCVNVTAPAGPIHPGGSGKINATIDYGDESGYVQQNLILRTTNDKVPLINLVCAADIDNKIELCPNWLDFGNMANGQVYTRFFRVSSHETNFLRGLEVSGGDTDAYRIAVELMTLKSFPLGTRMLFENNYYVQVSVKAKSGYIGPINGEVLIFGNLRGCERLKLPIRGFSVLSSPATQPTD